MRIQQLPLEKILFLDIETVPEMYQFSDLDKKQLIYTFKKTDLLLKEIS